MCCPSPYTRFMQTLLGTISQPTWKVASPKENAVHSGMYGELRWIRQQPSASQYACVRAKKIKRQRGERSYMSIYALVCMCVPTVKVSEGNIDMLYAAHMEQQERGPGVLHFLQRPPLRWPASAHCHPDSTSVNILKPLLLPNSSKPKETDASFSAVKAENRISGG